jgi:hypothetical protein
MCPFHANKESSFELVLDSSMIQVQARSLDRGFDRTLSQLKRSQRMRLGQPVPPKLEVRHSLS